jgi:hypothetical protein
MTPDVPEMLVHQREELRKKRDRASTGRRLAGAYSQRLTVGSEVDVGNSKCLRFRDANSRIAEQPHDDAMVMRAVRVEKCAVFVRT